MKEYSKIKSKIKCMRENWKKEVIFDMRALGGEFFYFLVFLRALIGDSLPFVYQLSIAGLSIFIFSLFLENFDGYVTRGFVLLIFISLFYDNQLFYIFAIVLFLALGYVIVHNLKISKEKVFRGFIVGIISVLLGYGGSLLLVNYF